MKHIFDSTHLHRWMQRSYPILAAGVTQAFAVFSFVLAVRWLPPAELGTWAMFLTLASFLEMARMGLVQPALVHLSAHITDSEKSALRAAALLLGMGVGFAGGLLLSILGLLLNQIWHLPGLANLLFWYPVIALVSAPLRWQDAVYTAQQDFGCLLRSAILYGSLYFVLLFLGKFFWGTLPLSAWLGLQIPTGILTLLFKQKKVLADLGFSATGFPAFESLRIWMRKIWQFGRFGLGSNLFSMFFQRADVLLLAVFVAPAGLAAYNVATRIVTWLDFPLNAFSQAFFPQIAAANCRSGTAGVRQLHLKSVKTLLAFAVPLSVGAFCAADVLVHLIAGDAFPEAAKILRILLVANLAKPFGRMLGIVLDATGRPAENFRMVLLSLAANLALLVCLVPTLGITGAAIASTAGILLTTGLGQWYFKTSLVISSKIQTAA